MITYTEIAESLAKGLGNAETPTALKNAITIMRKNPDLCAKLSVWDETIWLCIEEFLNNGGQPDNEDYFLRACALLEQEKG
jgi:hypothetical protein